VIVELENIKAKTWNTTLIEAGVRGTIFQCTYWAEYLKKTYGDHPIYLASTDDKGNIQGLLLAIESCYAKHQTCNRLNLRTSLFDGLYGRVVSPLLHRMLPFIFWENGPIIVSQSTEEKNQPNRTLFREILQRIVEKAQKRGCYEIKFARPAFFNDQSDIFSALGFWKRRMGTILVNLEQPPDVMWTRIKRLARKNIKRLQDAEIIKVSKRDELEEFYNMHVQTTVRAGVKTYPFSYFTSLWDHFSKTNMITVFIARLKDNPIGGSLSLMFNNTIHEYALADSDYARSCRLYSGDLLKWHTMKWGHEKGLRYFDLTGVEFYKIDMGDKKAENIYRYKSKWGGQLVEFNDYGKVFPRKRKIVSMLNLYFADSR